MAQTSQKGGCDEPLSPKDQTPLRTHCSFAEDPAIRSRVKGLKLLKFFLCWKSTSYSLGRDVRHLVLSDLLFQRLVLLSSIRANSNLEFVYADIATNIHS